MARLEKGAAQIREWHTRHPDDQRGAKMRERIDTPEGRAQYAQRVATVEPVFANLRANKPLIAS